jgi:beta-glucosidase
MKHVTDLIYVQLANFTLEEKVNVTTGVGWMNGRCVGNIPAIEPIRGRGWPGLCLEVRILNIEFMCRD